LANHVQKPLPLRVVWNPWQASITRENTAYPLSWVFAPRTPRQRMLGDELAPEQIVVEEPNRRQLLLEGGVLEGATTRQLTQIASRLEVANERIGVQLIDRRR
jgi:hypothetical protein